MVIDDLFRYIFRPSYTNETKLTSPFSFFSTFYSFEEKVNYELTIKATSISSLVNTKRLGFGIQIVRGVHVLFSLDLVIKKTGSRISRRRDARTSQFTGANRTGTLHVFSIILADDQSIFFGTMMISN